MSAVRQSRQAMNTWFIYLKGLDPAFLILKQMLKAAYKYGTKIYTR